MRANMLQFRCWAVAAALFLLSHATIPLNAAGLGYADSYCHQWYPSVSKSLMVLLESPSSVQRPFLFGCSEKNALLSALDELLMVRLDLFMNLRQQQFIPANLSRYTGFDDIVGLYELLRMVNTMRDDQILETSAVLQGVPFADLIACVPYKSVKEALLLLQQGNPICLVRIVEKDNHMHSDAEKHSAWACCLVMLVAVCNTVVDVNVRVRGIASCINLIQIYEQVEQLPIENVLQAMHSLLYRIGIMLDSLSQKEEGFVGWLKNKWVYLPVAVIIIAMRIAKYYWGSHNIFGSYTGGNQWNNVSQFSNDGSFGTHNLLFETRIKEGNSKLKNAEVVVGSA